MISRPFGFILSAWLLLFCLVFTTTALAQSCEDVLYRIGEGQRWILNAQRPDGLFTYEYLPLEDKFTNKDNIVRQTGTFWVLIESLDYSRNDAVVAAIQKFREKLNTYIIRSKAGEDDVAYIEFEGFGKINTSALYILSLLSLEKQGFPLTEREKLDLPLFERGMRKMSDEEGGFWYLYYLPKEKNLITSYGSGEALFALAKYYDYTNDIEGLKWTYEAFGKYYDRFLKHETDFQATEARAFFSWSIYALAIINKKYPIEYEKTVKPLLDLAFNKRKNNNQCKNRGCFLARNLGDAPFFEGMVQAYRMAVENGQPQEEIDRIRYFIGFALKDFADLQIIDVNEFRREYGFKGTPKNVVGAFCWDKRCTQIRNDLTQHAISAMIYYSDEFCKPSEKPEKPARALIEKIKSLLRF